MTDILTGAGLIDQFKDEALSGEGVKGKTARAACDAYASDPTAGAMISASNQGFGAAMREGCQPYWDGPDGYAPPSAPSSQAPFSGGQCDTNYSVTIEWEEGQGTGSHTFPTLGGPIGSPSTTFERDEGGGYEQYRVEFEYQVNPTVRATATHRFDTTGGGYSDFFVTRKDGEPDDCGDPPESYIPPAPGSPPPGTGYGEPRDVGGPGSPRIITPIEPVMGPDGIPYMPFFTPTGVEPLRPGDDDPPMNPDDPTEGPPSDVSGGGDQDDTGDPAVDKPLLGYRYQVIDSAPGFQTVIPGTSPRIYARVVGSLQLKIRTANGGISYTPGLQIKEEQGILLETDPSLKVIGCCYSCLPTLGLRLYEIRGEKKK